MTGDIAHGNDRVRGQLMQSRALYETELMTWFLVLVFMFSLTMKAATFSGLECNF